MGISAEGFETESAAAPAGTGVELHPYKPTVNPDITSSAQRLSKGFCISNSPQRDFLPTNRTTPITCPKATLRSPAITHNPPDASPRKFCHAPAYLDGSLHPHSIPSLLPRKPGVPVPPGYAG